MQHSTGRRTTRRRDAEYAVSLNRWRAWFDDADATPTETPSDSSTTAGGEEAGSKTEVPTWLPERLRRAEEKAAKAEREKLLKQLGIEDPDADAALLQEARKRKQDEMSLAERAAKELEKVQAERVKLEEALASERSARLNDRREALLRTAAQKAGAVDVDDVLLWAKASSGEAYESLVKLDGDALTSDPKAADNLIEAARKAKPHYFKAAGPGTPSLANGTRPGTATNTAALERASLLNQRRIRG